MAVAKKKPKYNPNSVIRGALRRAFARSPIVQEVMQASRREVPRFNKDGSRHKKNSVQRQCQVCDEWVGSTKMAVDHIEPVVSIEDGFNDWNEFIDRLWCDKKNLQRICDTCHDAKTTIERTARLTKQYSEELNTLEDTLDCDWIAYQIDPALLLKNLKKYTAKKKTKALINIVERAQKLIEKFNIKKKYWKELGHG